MVKFGIDLNDMLRDLQKHKRDKNTMFLQCVEDRLNQAMIQYYKQLTLSVNTLRFRDTANVIKELDDE